MKRKVILILSILVFMLFTNVNLVYADQNTSPTTDFWGAATDWFNVGKSESDNKGENATVKDIIEEIENMILLLGTTVIVVCTIFLGIKMIYGSANSKADAKTGLFNLIVACVFFFGFNSIKNLLFPDNTLIFLSSADTSYKDPIGRIFNISVYIAQFAAILAVIYVGIKYIFAGINGKTDLKEKSPSLLIGIILAFCSTGFLTYISNVINDVLAK